MTARPYCLRTLSPSDFDRLLAAGGTREAREEIHEALRRGWKEAYGEDIGPLKPDAPEASAPAETMTAQEETLWHALAAAQAEQEHVRAALEAAGCPAYERPPGRDQAVEIPDAERVRRLAGERDAARVLNAQALAVLRAVEWSASSAIYDDPCCPWCAQEKPSDPDIGGHSPGCNLAAVKAALAGGSAPGGELEEAASKVSTSVSLQAKPLPYFTEPCPLGRGPHGSHLRGTRYGVDHCEACGDALAPQVVGEASTCTCDEHAAVAKGGDDGR